MDKMRSTKEAYEKKSLSITEFDKVDVIVTSPLDDQTEILPGRDIMQTH